MGKSYDRIGTEWKNWMNICLKDVFTIFVSVHNFQCIFVIPLDLPFSFFFSSFFSVYSFVRMLLHYNCRFKNNKYENRIYFIKNIPRREIFHQRPITRTLYEIVKADDDEKEGEKGEKSSCWLIKIFIEIVQKKKNTKVLETFKTNMR